MGLCPKVLILFLLIIAPPLTQTGCWDHQEVEKLGIVLATALDQAPDGRVRLTAQIINPKALAGGSGLGGGGGIGGVSRPYRNISTEGSTVLDCIRLLSLYSPYQLFFAHNQTLLISEELARNRGIEELLDFFDRNPQIRRSAWILISRSDISSVMELPGETQVPSSQRIANIIRQQRLSSYYPDIQLGDFLESLETEGSDVFTMGIQVEPNETEVRDQLAGDSSRGGERLKTIGALVKIGGTAVFNGNRLAGWLNERESRGLLWVKGQVKEGVISVPCSMEKTLGQNQSLSLEILRSKSRIHPEFIDGKLSVTVKVEASTNIQESECMEELNQPEVIRSIEEALASAIQIEVEAALAKAQHEYHADVFGFGEAVHRKYPGVWKELKADWPKTYQDLPVYVEIDAKIARTGLVTKPVEVHR